MKNSFSPSLRVVEVLKVAEKSKSKVSFVPSGRFLAVNYCKNPEESQNIANIQRYVWVFFEKGSINIPLSKEGTQGGGSNWNKAGTKTQETNIKSYNSFKGGEHLKKVGSRVGWFQGRQTWC